MAVLKAAWLMVSHDPMLKIDPGNGADNKVFQSETFSTFQPLVFAEMLI